MNTYRVVRAIARPLFKLWFRSDIVGLENLPANGAFILAPGAHRSIIDTPIVAQCGPRVLRYMGASNYFDVPVLGQFLDAMGGFPVDREASDRAAFKLAEGILAAGEPLVMFPEGTRGEGPVIAPLKEGVAFLACRAQVPIVPVGIGGAARSMPPGAKLAKPTKVSLVVGEPILPPVPEDGKRTKRSTVREVNALLQARLQEVFDLAEISAGVRSDQSTG